MKTMIATAMLACAAGAFGAEAPAISVRLVVPTGSGEAFAQGASRWTCAGATCTGPDLNARHGDARACRELANRVGAVAAYVSMRGAMDAAALAKCNTHAKPA